MLSADVPKRAYRDLGDRDDLPSASRSSPTWTTAQILTPILITLALSVAFTLFLLHKSGRLSRLTSILPFMHRSRQDLTPRGWSIDGDTPSRGVLRHAESTPMIRPPLHWSSLSTHDPTDPQRLSTRTRTGPLTPAFSNAIRSIQRLFGVGPVRVSRVPVSDTFDLEDRDIETDPFDTLRSNSSRVWRNGLSSLGRSSASSTDRLPSKYSETSQNSAALKLEFDNVRGDDQDAANFVGDGGSDDHDTESANEVMLISRNGQDFSLTGSVISMPIGNSTVETDQRSVEVVPPTPTVSNKPLYHARSVSTPHLQSPSSDLSPIHSFSPSGLHFQPPLVSPTPILAHRTAPGNPAPSREGAIGAHYYTAATPPIEVASTLSLSSSARSRRTGADYSPPVSPQLQNYAPSFPGRSHPSSPYVLPGSVPSSPIRSSDLQNLIPSAVRGAGYNPFQHPRSASELE